MISLATQFFINLILILSASIIGLYALLTYADWRSEHKSLHLRIRKLDDGRYYVKYYWGFWEDVHREYVIPEQITPFMEKLVRERLFKRRE